jgi:hypothetical protein
LGLYGPEPLEESYRDLAIRLGPDVVVAEMAEPGVNLALGMIRDEQFGPLVVVGAGGVLVEILWDRRLAMPPLDEERARAMLDRLKMRPLLDGTRGARGADIDAVCHAIAGLSWLAIELGDRIEALDANPVIAGPKGCVAVDALVVPRRIEQRPAR